MQIHLGYGNGNERHLWGETVEMHIEYMYIIYDSLKIKPEWLTEQQIKVYSDLMLQIKNDKIFKKVLDFISKIVYNKYNK